jgi:Ala-tRNA(Pro) deacylase
MNATSQNAMERLKQFLDKEHVRYTTVAHSPSYTAQEIAADAHVSGKELAKTVMVDLDGQIAMAVLPADQKVALPELREAAGVSKARFATEDEFKGLFPDCETGAMPPFGNLYGMDVYVAAPLTEDEEIAFNAGSHTQLMRIAYRDFERLVHPKVADFTV